MFDELLIAQFDVAFLRACGIAWPEAEQHMKTLRWQKLYHDLRLEKLKFDVTPPFFLTTQQPVRSI